MIIGYVAVFKDGPETYCPKCVDDVVLAAIEVMPIHESDPDAGCMDCAKCGAIIGKVDKPE